MSYCTRADIEERIGVTVLAQIADVDQDGGEDPKALVRAIADVDAVIDASLGVRWPECVGQASDLLRILAVDLVVYRLARGLARTQEMADRAAEADVRLKAIAAGQIQPCDAGTSAPAGGAGSVEMGESRKVFDGGIY